MYKERGAGGPLGMMGFELFGAIVLVAVGRQEDEAAI
jgi:hypothetical protein